MAIQRKFVMGNFTNKIGTVVGQSIKGVPIVRSLEGSKNRNPSDKQFTQRARHVTMSRFTTILRPKWIDPLWKARGSRMSPSNAFTRANFAAFNGDGNILFSQVNFAGKQLLPPGRVTMSTYSSNIQVGIYDSNNDNLAHATDSIWLIVFDYERQLFLFIGDTGRLRPSTGAVYITLPAVITNHHAIVICYVSADRRLVGQQYFNTYPGGVDVSFQNQYTDV